MPSHLDLPQSTISLLEDSPPSVSRVQSWANEALDAGFTDDEIIDLYAMNENDTDRCAELLPKALQAVGAWRASTLGRLGVRRDLIVQSMLADRMDLERFLALGLDAIRAVCELKGDALTAQMRLELATFYELDDTINPALFAHLNDRAKAKLLSEGIDVSQPKPWVLQQLLDAGIIAKDGSVIPAAWDL